MKFKSGDQIVFGRSKRNAALRDITIGRIYKVFSTDGEAVFLDDAGDLYFVEQSDSIGKPTKIVK